MWILILASALALASGREFTNKYYDRKGKLKKRFILSDIPIIFLTFISKEFGIVFIFSYTLAV